MSKRKKNSQRTKQLTKTNNTVPTLEKGNRSNKKTQIEGTLEMEDIGTQTGSTDADIINNI